jgi:uncharacterized protein YjbJ (UPF0337 family)
VSDDATAGSSKQAARPEGRRGLCDAQAVRTSPKQDRKVEMSDSQTNERVTGGLVGKVAGKAKELAGELTDREDLAREGRLQQAQTEAQLDAQRAAADARQAEQEAELEREKAETRAERLELEAEVEKRRRAERAEVDREQAEDLAETRAEQEIQQASAERIAEERAAEAQVEHGEARAEQKDEEALRMEQQARQAERKADALDPEEDNQ